MSTRGLPSVAVIGAGMAGLSCAVALQRAGVRVNVFDKSHGPSGRMSMRRGDGWECDHGAQYFTARDPAFRAEVARWETAGAAAAWAPRLRVFGGSRAAARAVDVARFVGVPRMTAPAAWLGRTLAMTMETTVGSIARDMDGWRVINTQGEICGGSFDAVVLALPAPQAVPLLLPVAPQLAALAGSAVMQPCWTMILCFDTPCGLPFDAAFVNCGPLRWVARNNSKPGRSGLDTWVLHASPEWSEAFLEHDADSVADLMVRAFVDLGGAEPARRSAHRWRFALAQPPLSAGCRWQADTGIGLCGDWLHGGTVEGAWLSGQALARQISSS